MLELAAKDAAKIITENKKLSRRDFLKSAFKGAAGLYLSSPLISKLLTAFSMVEGGGNSDERSVMRRAERAANDIDEKIHPELNDVLITLRNHLLAQKMITIAKNIKSDNKKPEISIVVGAGHHGIEDALNKGAEERLAVIKKTINSPALNDEARKNISKIARLDFDKKEKKWKATISSDPYLEEYIEKEK